MRLDDTIAAIATPLQPSGLGVIRVSGEQAVSAVEALFKTNGKPLKKTETHKLVHGWIKDDGKLIDKVLVVVMRAPHSYTCLLYTFDAPDETDRLYPGDRVSLKKNNKNSTTAKPNTPVHYMRRTRTSTLP